MPVALESPLGHANRVAVSTLVHVEIRKLVDTRAGRWLLAAIVLLSLAGLAVTVATAGPEDLTYASLVNVTVSPMNLLLPVLGILTITSEWGQRTALVTFVLEPRRGRVIAAKLVAVIIVSVVAALVALGVAALGNVVGASFFDGAGTWTFSMVDGAELLLGQTITGLQGLAFGMLLMNSAVAIVSYFVLPMVWGILTISVDWFSRSGGWIDISAATASLIDHDMDPRTWAYLGVSVTVWVVIPMTVGFVRILRREVKPS